MIGQHRRLLIAVDGAWLLIAVDGALLALNPMEPDCDADENIHAGLYDEYGSSPLCGPEKENIWVVSTWDFQEPGVGEGPGVPTGEAGNRARLIRWTGWADGGAAAISGSNSQGETLSGHSVDDGSSHWTFKDLHSESAH